MSDPSFDKRNEIADKLTKSTRPTLVAMAVFAAIAVVDLLTGFLLDDRRFDALILAGCLLGLWSFLELRWFAGKVRTHQVPSQLGIVRWFAIVAGTLLGFGLIAEEGYAMGGPWVAVMFVAGFVALTAFGIVRGIRQRRRTAH